jgi:hypothetical protein
MGFRHRLYVICCLLAVKRGPYVLLSCVRGFLLFDEDILRWWRLENTIHDEEGEITSDNTCLIKNFKNRP